MKLPREMTLAQFNQQYPSTIPIEELAIINELEGPESVIPRGRTVKRVVGGRTDDRPVTRRHPERSEGHVAGGRSLAASDTRPETSLVRQSQQQPLGAVGALDDLGEDR